MNRKWWTVVVAGLVLAGCEGTDRERDGGNTDVAGLDDVAGGDAADILVVPDVRDVTEVQEPLPCAPYQGRGPWLVGVTTLDLPDRQVEVWYPAAPGTAGGQAPAEYDIRDWLPEGQRERIPDSAPSRYATRAFRDLPAASGRFPLMLFSHGFAAFRTQSSEITTHLASWGFVVAAPDYPERGLAAVLDMTLVFESPDRDTQDAVIDMLIAQDAAPSGLLSGRVDASRVIASGHSAGGFASLKALELPRVAGAIVLAAGFFQDPENPVQDPVLIIAGTADDIAPYRLSRSAYDKVPPPRAFAGVQGAGHLAFSDLCEVAKEAGGIVQLAIDSGLDVPEFLTILGSDGCTSEELAAPLVWPVVNHLAVAFARFVLGIDVEPVGMDAQTVQGCFADILKEYEFEQATALSDP